ncbi:MAG: zinc finger Ran-binding domain-containing protein [Gemmatimonadota bacterium]|nr:zinc finger Ran-binding domain-containing protein [Gemmatimonadota bacterium]MDH5283188.1 zinc finger Ran-binding domain-containing protein [Gemmatimonadota bacterium]
MPKPTAGSDTPIEQLLRERAQFVGWLTRLNSSGEAAGNVPEAVRSRVRADYERRLQTVVEQLRTHTSALESQVATNTSRAAGLAATEAELKEQYSESEIRHVVGEYDDLKWEGIRTELLKSMAQVKEQLDQTHQEIARLNEVLATVRAPARPGPVAISVPAVAPPPPPAPAPLIETHAPPKAAAAPPVEEPESASRQAAAKKGAPRKDEQGRTLWFPSGKGPESAPETGGKLDELAFLKSVTDAESLSSTAGRTRSSGSFAKPPADAPAPAEPAPAGTPAPESKDRNSSGHSTAPKTLKCGECGTLNRPTEWYCERCGAELATL